MQIFNRFSPSSQDDTVVWNAVRWILLPMSDSRTADNQITDRDIMSALTFVRFNVCFSSIYVRWCHRHSPVVMKLQPVDIKLAKNWWHASFQQYVSNILARHGKGFGFQKLPRNSLADCHFTDETLSTV